MDQEAPCTFSRRSNKPPKSRASAALRYEFYACSYGREEKRGKHTKKQRTSFVKKRGCQCHFIVKVMVQNLDVAILTYNVYDHEDGDG
uniref:Uncharacterized protein n=1 Tax=Picea sitchensis TaxID=3332 RepID=D5A943_PICSI|nr:unknown [Picea sitchensis]